MNQPARDACAWTQEWDGEFWNTACGQAFQFFDAGPTENVFKFCCYCGKPLKAVEAIEENDDDD